MDKLPLMEEKPEQLLWQFSLKKINSDIVE